MATSGFEGFEKRLELHFFGDDPAMMGNNLGLRLLDFESLEQVLSAVQCTVVSAVANQYFDAYVLSESSLFVYPTKIIIKTCGTTQLLKSIRPLIHHACNLGLSLCSCRYTRGTFIFPKAQPSPHTSFKEEVLHLEDTVPDNLCYRKASVMPSKIANHSWHVFTACDESHIIPDDRDVYTVEVCMTDLDRASAREINPRAMICDFAFDPCGYSMNGIHNDRYSTIHVTPEDGFSYASFECVGSIFDDDDIENLVGTLRRAVQVFRPASLSVSTTCASHEVWPRVARALDPLGLKCRSCAADEFPSAGSIVFQTFTARRK
ncbi:hypothetical protein OIU84_018468 [Salix udensis]|uniref:adenosylmethionine decarboxylase n=1 Tax=Salix udensis TaxID=889485 RepID=A0AAD6PJT8_9ROSI|nr:hypothetical protein OIU84_018468 [Salix udensis]